ncbi:Methionine aminopeptidase 2, partial [Coemansia sp. RSA 2559]
MSVAGTIPETAGLENKVAGLSIESNGAPKEHANDDAEDDNSADEGANDDESAAKKKKKKKNKNKKKKKSGAGASGQTETLTVPVSQLFPNNIYPEGQICEYVDDNKYRTTSEEMRAKDRLNEKQIFDLRRAAEVHREVRHNVQKRIKPGMDLTTIAEMIENGTRTLVEANGLEAGIGFPTGLSINDCAAHFTPNAGDHVVLQADDVIKIDFGVQVNGHIIDSAFTMSWNDRYKPLLDAVQDATNTGIREAGIDVRLGDIGAAIQEVMESYEIELDGKTIPIRPIRNLCGHNIAPYSIHGGKSVPIVANNDPTRMEEGELFAIETFGSTGKGHVDEYG